MRGIYLLALPAHADRLPVPAGPVKVSPWNTAN